jgi:hypothetical protein
MTKKEIDKLAMDVAKSWEETVIAHCDSAAAAARADLAKQKWREADELASNLAVRASVLMIDARALTTHHAEEKVGI